jgi:hypothetical protein
MFKNYMTKQGKYIFKEANLLKGKLRQCRELGQAWRCLSVRE